MNKPKKAVLSMSESDKNRFFSKIVKGAPNECHEWTASIGTSGYGLFRVGCYQSMAHAHRVAYMLHHNIELPVDRPDSTTCVLHTCDNRKCCNPAHLWLGSRDDNMKDASKKGRIVSNGIPPIGIGEKNGRAKITETDVIYIRNLYKTYGADSLVVEFLTQKTGLTRSSIFDIILRRSWKHVD